MNEKILDKCRGNLEHAVRCRMNLDTDLSNLVATIEEVVEMTGMNRRFKDKTSTSIPEGEKSKEIKDKK
jgi:hypothetical protein